MVRNLDSESCDTSQCRDEVRTFQFKYSGKEFPAMKYEVEYKYEQFGNVLRKVRRTIEETNMEVNNRTMDVGMGVDVGRHSGTNSEPPDTLAPIDVIPVRKPEALIVKPPPNPITSINDIHKRRGNPIMFYPDRPITIGGVSLSRQQLAIKCGVHITTISRIFSGRREPNLHLFAQLTLAFQCSMEEMYNVLLRVKPARFTGAKNAVGGPQGNGSTKARQWNEATAKGNETKLRRALGQVDGEPDGDREPYEGDAGDETSEPDDGNPLPSPGTESAE